MSGGVVESDVFLDVHGEQIKAAFDAIDARIKAIQAHVDTISTRAKMAGESFGAGLQQSMVQFTKISSRLDQFEKAVRKNDPNVQKQAEVNKAYEQRERILAEGQNKRQQQEARMWAERDRRELTNAEKIEKTKERLAEQRWARERAEELKTERERSRLQEQNRLKNSREGMRSEVDAARGLTQLENQRLLATNRIVEARRMIGKFGAEEDRQLHQIIAQERERFRLADQRVKAENRQAASTAKSDAAVDSRLNIRDARAEERAAVAAMSIRDAKMRQAQLESQIAAQIERTRALTGRAKIEAERALKVDEARLAVVNQRVNALQREANAAARAAQPRPGTVGPPLPPGVKSPGSPPSGGGPDAGNGIFGAHGLAGVFLRTAAYGGAAAVIYGTISAMRDGIDDAIKFEDQMAKIGAVAGLSATQQMALGESIRDVAANSRFATNEIAEATMVLAQAGFSAADIGNSLQNVANLAAAAGVSFSEATDVITGAIGAFQLQTSETGHIADVLSAALNTTKLNIQQVALGIQYAGATAFENKMSFDELTAAMATMAQAGIRSGSTIGTGLRQFLVDLQTPTKKMAEAFDRLGISMKDIDVKTLGLPEVLKRLSDAGFSGAEAYASLETRAAAAYLVLKNNQDLLNRQITLQNQLGNSAEAAAKGSDSLAAEWQRFKNQLNEEVADKITPLGAAVKDLLHTFNELGANQDLRKMREELEKLEENSAAWAAQVDAIDAYKDALKENLAIISEHQAAIEAAETATNEANEAYAQHEQSVKASTDAIGKLIQRSGTLKNDTAALGAETATLMARFEGLAAQVYRLGSSYDGLLASMRAVRAEQIAMGALQANAQAIAADNRTRAYGGRAQSTINQIQASGLFGQLPKDIQDAIRKLAANPDSKDAGTWSRMVTDFANRSNLRGFEKDRLRLLSGDLSRVGLAKIDYNEARNRQDIMGHLGSQKGQAWLSRIDNLTGADDATIKKAIADIQRELLGPNKSKSVQGVGTMLLQMATGKLGSGQEPKSPESKGGGGRSNREAERKEREDDRRNAAILQLRMKATEAELKNAIKALLDAGGDTSIGPDGELVIGKQRTLTADRLRQNIERVDKTLEKWIQDRTSQIEGEIDKQNMDPNGEQARLMMEELAREIEAKREDVGRQVGDMIAKALDIMVEAIEAVTKRAEEAADHELAMVESRLAALDRQSLRGRVPDFVRATLERQAAEAKDERDRKQIGIQEAQLNSLSRARDQMAMTLDIGKSMGLITSDDPAIKALEALNDQITTLKNNTDELKASFSGEGLLPQSLTESLAMAIANYKEVNHLTASWAELISMNLTDALGNAHSLLEGFLNDATSGTMTVQQAWANMVRNLIKYLQQLLVKMIAVKLMQAALSLFGGGARFDAAGFQQIEASNFAAMGMFHGGNVKGAYRGEHIREGVSNRDSVLRKLAKGEFVVRKRAVDSVGVDFMRDLNERGAMAMKAMGPKIVMPAPVEQKMNVFVVAPEHQPTMGPNDVLVTIANDIYRNGPTKQLIKSVVQGA